MKRRHLLAAPAGLVFAAAPAHAADAMDPQLRRRTVRAVAGGLHYLRGQQAPDGSVLKSVGITALSLRAFLESPEKYSESDGPFITRQVEFLLANVRSDGSISTTLQSTAYNTAVALNALAATKNPKYDAVIAAARKFLLSHQADEGEGYKPDHPFYGGIGYGGGERPDMSNVYIVLEGLKATSTDPKDPVWQKALVFVNRSQNRSESNDQKWAANDGGFAYRPGSNPDGVRERHVVLRRHDGRRPAQSALRRHRQERSAGAGRVQVDDGELHARSSTPGRARSTACSTSTTPLRR